MIRRCVRKPCPLVQCIVCWLADRISNYVFFFILFTGEAEDSVPHNWPRLVLIMLVMVEDLIETTLRRCVSHGSSNWPLWATVVGKCCFYFVFVVFCCCFCLHVADHSLLTLPGMQCRMDIHRHILHPSQLVPLFCRSE